MYIPTQFLETRQPEIERIIKEHPLGMIVTSASTGLDANHLPFLAQFDGLGKATLMTHVARKNTLWRTVVDGDAVLVAFRGVDGYISPSWYPSKAETHERVPTWNYEVVHAHGQIFVHDSPAFLRKVVARLTREQEAHEPEPWKMSDAPTDFLSREMANVVGLEVRVARFECKRKLNQHHEQRDREGAISELLVRGRQGLAEAMRAAVEPPAG